jgi:hypothetical protein
MRHPILSQPDRYQIAVKAAFGKMVESDLI